MATRKRLGEQLIEARKIDKDMLNSALGHQRRWGGRLGQALLDLKLVDEASIVEALAHTHGFEVARLTALEPHALAAALKLVSKDFATRHLLFPMAADQSTLTVAMADPANLGVSDELRFRTNRRVKVCIGGDREIAEAIRANYPSDSQQMEAISLDNEVSGEFLPPLADPFGGGSSEDMENQMFRPVRPGTGRPATPPEAAGEGRVDRFGSGPRAGAARRDEDEKSGLTPLPLPAAPVARPAPPPVPPPPPASHAAPPPHQPSPHPPAPSPARPAAPRPAFGQVPSMTPAPARPAAYPVPIPQVVVEEEAVEGRIPLRPLTPKEIVVLDALERLAAGQDDVPLPVKPSQVAAALLRIMLRLKIVSQQELLDELLRK
jgi:type IV pilus assembly protein PilB